MTPQAELLAYTKYIRELFPDSKTIFLRRNPSKIAESGWWKDRNTYDLRTLRKELVSFQNECKNIAIPGHDLCLDYKILLSQDLRSIRKNIYEPLELKFNRQLAAEALAQKLNHSKWNHLNP